MISVFANIRIRDTEGLEHLKDSFYSFAAISDNWVINVRGELRDEAIVFLKGELQERMVLFELLDDNRGWLTNALDMMPAVTNDYVLVWNEDHINMFSTEKAEALLEEMKHYDVEYLQYSHYEHWRKKFNRLLKSPIITRGKTLDFANVTKENLWQFFPEEKRECILSSPAIFQKAFLVKNMRRERKKLPFWCSVFLRRVLAFLARVLPFDQKKAFDTINRTVFYYALPRFPKKTPFELEVMQDHTYVLPVRVASPHEEFFACIDDDVDKRGSMEGYQLIKRGEYPIRSLLTIQRELPAGMRLLQSISLDPGQTIEDRYYLDTYRTYALLRATVRSSGAVEITSGNETLETTPGMLVGFYPNIRHRITAREQTMIDLYTSAPLDATFVHPHGEVYAF